MSLIKEIIGATLMGLRLVSRPDDNKILSVYFHNPSVKLFHQMISWLHKKGYQFISIRELDELIVQKQAPAKRLAFISFDDGNKEYPDLLPTIEKYKVPVTVFIPTNPVVEGNYWWDYAGKKEQSNFTGLPTVESFKVLPVQEFDLKLDVLKQHLKLERSCMTLSELKVLAKHPYITIGAHTVSHPILKNCDAARQSKELEEGQSLLNEWLQQNTVYLAYPNGDYNDTTLELADKYGYRLGFTTKPGQINTAIVSRLEIPRYSVNDEGGYYENLAKINGYWQRLFPPN
jgi:peptidoglycan/xylan/chitin deacetylase (PgdA/CDA1 family)